MALVCPHCGVFTSFSPLPLRGRGILLKRSSGDTLIWEDVSLHAVTDPRYLGTADAYYAIVSCQACEKWFVASRSPYVEEWSSVHPIPHKTASEDIPEPIKSEFEEASLCFAVQAYRACLLVCRAALIDMQRDRGVSNLEELWDKGTISETLYRQAHQVRLWGNLVAHEPVLPDAITKEDCEQVLAYLESLLDAVYVQPKKLARITGKLGQIKKGTKAKPPPIP